MAVQKKNVIVFIKCNPIVMELMLTCITYLLNLQISSGDWGSNDLVVLNHVAS
jgi:hypothetical protein